MDPNITNSGDDLDRHISEQQQEEALGNLRSKMEMMIDYDPSPVTDLAWQLGERSARKSFDWCVQEFYERPLRKPEKILLALPRGIKDGLSRSKNGIFRDRIFLEPEGVTHEAALQALEEACAVYEAHVRIFCESHVQWRDAVERLLHHRETLYRTSSMETIRRDMPYILQNIADWRQQSAALLESFGKVEALRKSLLSDAQPYQLYTALQGKRKRFTGDFLSDGWGKLRRDLTEAIQVPKKEDETVKPPQTLAYYLDMIGRVIEQDSAKLFQMKMPEARPRKPESQWKGHSRPLVTIADAMATPFDKEVLAALPAPEAEPEGAAALQEWTPRDSLCNERAQTVARWTMVELKKAQSVVGREPNR